ncbi:helix-turn-helix domain-containing protein [Paludibacterium denitrificans]|uniref:helix-turn-helix domain-containing protein n=1 Tax=Paludibacterium denitrificans TaxID=2675226 RepID=UPI0035E43F48
MLLAHLHEAVTRLALTNNMFTRSVTLTPREKECLSWVSAGKTSWEIARILNVAEATVIFHISNA